MAAFGGSSLQEIVTGTMSDRTQVTIQEKDCGVKKGQENDVNFAILVFGLGQLGGTIY